MNAIDTPSLTEYCQTMAHRARAASSALALVSTDMKNRWLMASADLLDAEADVIIAANAKDLENAPSYNLDAAQRRVTNALAAFAGHGGTIRLAEDIRNALRTHVRIDWIGPVGELMTDDGEFARSVRADFLDQEGTAGASAIDPAQEAEFRDFLSSWMSGA